MNKNLGTVMILAITGFASVVLIYTISTTKNVHTKSDIVSTNVKSLSEMPVQLEDSSSETIESNTHRVNNLEQNLHVLRKDISQLIELQQYNSEVLASLSNQTQIASVDNTPQENKQNLESETEIEQAEKLRDREYQLQVALSNEDVDLQWANEITQTVQLGFENEELSGINLNNIECGSTICQLDIQIDENIPSQESLQRLSTNRTWDGETTFSLDKNGKLKLFFAKKSHSLPDDS